jgi:hypothetical protein
MRLVRDERCRTCAGRQSIEPIGRSVAVARASAERRGGPLAGRAGRAATVWPDRLGGNNPLISR